MVQIIETINALENTNMGILVVHWLGLCSLTAKGKGSIPVKGTKIPQALRYGPKLKKKKKLNIYFVLFILQLFTKLNTSQTMEFK